MKNLLKQFRDDENGAAMVEYSILLGIIAVAVVMTVIAIGGWVSGRFTGLCDALDDTTVGGCNATTGIGS
ncbi:MAG: Flp family type IVb pilin [Mesorhizobium sp.]|uniref:Flp family type IVb pilin n=1 Tax=Mesorhizobium sp. TaxID=1871066 RepID=UPI001219AD2E|nr:Flp family type IVb pilin [Mesorhizobium sp.]TIL94669.1 MAG: Flp family type IVb pilin [Mesorhizobium sp.]